MRRLCWIPFFLLACSNTRLAEVDRTEFVFGSYVRIRALAPSQSKAENAVRKTFQEMFRLDTLWSGFLTGSEVALVNESGRALVSAETRDLIEAGLEFCRETEGALDITVQPLIEAWGFLGDGYRVPDTAELKALCKLIDFRKVKVFGDSVVLTRGVRIDLGAVAVGRAVDRAVETLKAAGVEQGLIDAGGDIRVFGNRVWRIGLQNPRGEGVIRVFKLRNQAVSTSGDYQKFFEVDGQRFCHIFDPGTGYPAGECASVTVVAQSALAADAYSTAVFVLGPEKGLKMVQARESLEVVVLVDRGDSLAGYESGGVK